MTILQTHRRSLPLQPTPFIGRTRESTEIADLLADPACRLLTLVGPGGIGKTHLALEVATRQQAAYDQTLPATRTQLGEAAFEAAWTTGRTMVLEQVIA